MSQLPLPGDSERREPDGSEQALARYRESFESAQLADDMVSIVLPDHTTQELARVSDLMLELDTLEGRVVRTEAASRAAIARAHYLECQLDSVRMALRLERVPRQADGGGALTLLGRIRWLGDKCRRAEQRADRLERELKRLRAEFTA